MVAIVISESRSGELFLPASRTFILTPTYFLKFQFYPTTTIRNPEKSERHSGLAF